MAREKDTRRAESLRNHFLSGYEQIRRLSPNEIAALPYFAMVNQIYLMRLRLEAQDTLNLADAYWEHQFKMLDLGIGKLG